VGKTYNAMNALKRLSSRLKLVHHLHTQSVYAPNENNEFFQHTSLFDDFKLETHDLSSEKSSDKIFRALGDALIPIQKHERYNNVQSQTSLNVLTSNECFLVQVLPHIMSLSTSNSLYGRSQGSWFQQTPSKDGCGPFEDSVDMLSKVSVHSGDVLEPVARRVVNLCACESGRLETGYTQEQREWMADFGWDSLRVARRVIEVVTFRQASMNARMKMLSSDRMTLVRTVNEIV
jgi:hypothetical protein